MFPVKGKRNQKSESSISESRLLIDPCEDNPEQHLLCDLESGIILSDTNLGRITIDVFNLNRSELQERRKQTIQDLSILWETFIKQKRFRQVQGEGDGDPLEEYFISIFSEENKEEFLLVKRLFIRTKIQGLNTSNKEHCLNQETWASILQKEQFISEDTLKKAASSYENYILNSDNYNLNERTQLNNYFRKKLTIQRIEISNFKNISKLEIDFPRQTDENVPWLMILGENSTGKTTILKAIALTLMGDTGREKLNLDARNFLRKGSSTGYVRIYLNSRKNPIELLFDKNSLSFEGNIEDTPVLLLGYGSTRLLMEENEELSYQGSLVRCENLFNQRVPLINAEQWLLQLKKARFKDAEASLKRLFAVNDDYRIYKKGRKKQKAIYTSMFGTGISLNEMSDGYKTITALACDIMMVLQEIWKDSKYAQGIVLVDEIDAHLHPRLKMKIIQRLRSVFPKLQFIVTSHEPLTLRGLKANEIIVLKRTKNRKIFSQSDLPSPEGMRVDQLLTSDYFGLNSTVDPEIELMYNRYYQLLSENYLDPAEAEELKQLKLSLNHFKLLGENQREQLVLEAVDEFISKNKQIIDKGNADNLKKETISRIVDIWEEI